MNAREICYLLAIGFISIGFGFSEWDRRKLIEIVELQQLLISGQQSIIASYKDNLTQCLKEHKIQPQDEFTGE